ncbi:MAG: response regulator transcription factor, partial [bacterium]|nr:response regulator transcription factor [bacterium]
MRVLVVEDQKELRQAVVRRLRSRGYGADEANDGEAADQYLATYDYAVVILDRMLPDGDAIERLRTWRQQGKVTPILFLTARDQVGDRVTGLEAGADDYLVKPFAMDELLARVSALARRRSLPRPPIIREADVEIDTGRREVRRAGVLIPLRPKEYVLLGLLAARVGHVVSRAEIVAGCWGEEAEPLSNVEEVVIA